MRPEDRPAGAPMRLLRRTAVVAAAALLLLTPPARHLVALGVAATAKTGAFRPLPADARVTLEPGADSLALAVAPALPGAVARVERGLGERFAGPVVVRCCATHESFRRFTATKSPVGVVILARLFLSPRLLRTPQRVPGLLAHELTHLAMEQRIGHLAFLRLPRWYKEGTATWVSGGGGAETVSEAQARDSLLAGARLVPADWDGVLFEWSPTTRRLAPHLYYREAGMFVAHLDATHPGRMADLLGALERGTDFRAAFAAAFGTTPAKEWARFLAAEARAPR
jgi:hypothetical protein